MMESFKRRDMKIQRKRMLDKRSRIDESVAAWQHDESVAD
jgi:hypothetical protein